MIFLHIIHIHIYRMNVNMHTLCPFFFFKGMKFTSLCGRSFQHFITSFWVAACGGPTSPDVVSEVWIDGRSQSDLQVPTVGW